MQLTEQRIREIVREEIQAALEERAANDATADKLAEAMIKRINQHIEESFA